LNRQEEMLNLPATFPENETIQSLNQQNQGSGKDSQKPGLPKLTVDEFQIEQVILTPRSEGGLNSND